MTDKKDGYRTDEMRPKDDRTEGEFIFPADGDRPAVTIKAISREEAEEKYRKVVGGKKGEDKT